MPRKPDNVHCFSVQKVTHFTNAAVGSKEKILNTSFALVLLLGKIHDFILCDSALHSQMKCNFFFALTTTSSQMQT